MAGGGVPGSSGGEDDEGEGSGFVEPNIVPLVDIMLVLLVILMAGSSAIVRAGDGGEAPGSGFRVNLPSGTGDQAMADITDELVITVLETGEIVLRDELVEPSELERILSEEASVRSDRLVLVQADENAVHSRVVEVMEVARKVGLLNLAIATRAAQTDE